MNAVEIIDLDKSFQENQTKNVCAYARVSTKKDLQEASLLTQVETYTKKIKENPEWSFTGVFTDFGKSGTNLKHREQFNQMIELAKAGGIDLIITKSISRFARNTVDCLRIIQELKGYNVEVWFEQENISSFDPKVELTITIYASLAEEESRIISQNKLWNVQKQFKEGQVPMVTSKLLGYRRVENGNIEIDVEEAKIVRRIFTLYSKGYSQNYIAEELNKDGLRTKHYNLPYRGGTIRSILMNERYNGNALLQKSRTKYVGDKNRIKNQQSLPKYFVENSHPAIISDALWKEVQTLKMQRIQKYNGTTDPRKLKQLITKSVFSGIVECAKCGRHFHYKVNHPGEVYETSYLMCSSNKTRKTCEMELIYVDAINDVLVSHINQIISNKSAFLGTLKGVLTSHPSISNINIDLARNEYALSDLNNQIKSLLHVDNEYRTDLLNEIKDKKAELESNILQYKNKLLTSYNIDSIMTQYKSVLKGFKNPIKSIDEFPFTSFFSTILVHSRNKVELVLNPFGNTSYTSIYSFPENTTSAVIRKTPYEVKSSISCF